jgi:hypothetical protein
MVGLLPAHSLSLLLLVVAAVPCRAGLLAQQGMGSRSDSSPLSGLLYFSTVTVTTRVWHSPVWPLGSLEKS